MDETTYKISRSRLTVNFDLREQENCFIILTFTRDDILNILNMDAFRKENIEVKGIEGMASLPRNNVVERNICFTYRNKSKTAAGTVFYPYQKMINILDDAFTKINSPEK